MTVNINNHIKVPPALASITAWGYRVVLADGIYSIREVYLDAGGGVVLVAEEPAYPQAETLAELYQDLALYVSAIEHPAIGD